MAKIRGEKAQKSSRVYIGERCKEARVELDIIQGDLAKRLNTSQALISTFEKKGNSLLIFSYLEFLYEEGYNPNYFLIRNNTAIPKMRSETQLSYRFLKDLLKNQEENLNAQITGLTDILNDIKSISQKIS